ncbi:chalcone isomerase family protein [Thermodesulfobacteriota bacterium B35]
MRPGQSLYTILLLCSLFITVPAAGREVDGVTLPESIDLAGHHLLLNGAGVRSKYLLDIYVGALYLDHRQDNGAAIAAADAPMLMRMHFLFDGVPPERLRRGWMKGLKKRAPHADAELERAMRQFCDLFTVRVRRHDVYDVAWLPGRGLEVSFNGHLLAAIDSLPLKRALFAIWLGDPPGDPDLKRGLLGP